MKTTVFLVFGLIIVPLLIMAIALLCGKGAFMIAGYNTMSKDEQAKYNEKALCRFVGGLLFVVSFCLLLVPLSVQYDRQWQMFVGIALSIIVPIGAVIYMNTNGRFRKG